MRFAWLFAPVLAVVIWISAGYQVEAVKLEPIYGPPAYLALDHNGPWLPGDITTWTAQRRALNRGYFTYCFDDNAAAYPNFKSQAKQVADFAASKTRFQALEAPFDDDCDVKNIMPDDQTFLSTCGQGAAGCIQYWRSPSVIIMYRRSLGYSDWRSALCHEGATSTGHFMGLHEQYNDVLFVSDGKTWTCMDFGTFVWQLPDWDRDRIWNCWVPDVPALMALNTSSSSAQAVWSSDRRDGGAAHCNGIKENSNATRMSFGYADNPNGVGVIWAGEVCKAQFNFCFTDYKNLQRGFDSWWKGKYIYGRAESPLAYAIPQVSAPNYWTLFGYFP